MSAVEVLECFLNPDVVAMETQDWGFRKCRRRNSCKALGIRRGLLLILRQICARALLNLISVDDPFGGCRNTMTCPDLHLVPPLQIAPQPALNDSEGMKIAILANTLIISRSAAETNERR
jgi:hypothetical protein